MTARRLLAAAFVVPVVVIAVDQWLWRKGRHRS